MERGVPCATSAAPEVGGHVTNHDIAMLPAPSKWQASAYVMRSRKAGLEPSLFEVLCVRGLLTFMVLSPSYVTSFWKYEMRICIGTQSQHDDHS